jgi:translation initiation factor IF-3
MILDRLAEELAEIAVVEQRPIQDGRNMTMMLGPSKAVLSGELVEAAADGDAPEGDAPEGDADGAPEPAAAAEAEAAPAPKAAAKPAAAAKPQAAPEPVPSDIDGDPAKI